MATFSLLLGFALVKILIGVAIVWLGSRTAERPEDDGGGSGPFSPPNGPPGRFEGRPARGRRRVRATARVRGRPQRLPRRSRAVERTHA